MSNKRGIGLTVLVCIITSVLTSLLTTVVMKNNIGDTNQNSAAVRPVLSTLTIAKSNFASFHKTLPCVVLPSLNNTLTSTTLIFDLLL